MPAPADGTPRQSKPENAEYRVVFAPFVVVRLEPWGVKVGEKQVGEIVRTSTRTVGGKKGDWVKLVETFDGKEGWMLLDGAAIGLGPLLERVDRAKRGRVQRYRIGARSEVYHVRDKPGGTVIGTRPQGRILRADMELQGWVRLQEDFYRSGCAEPLEGWAQVSGFAHGVAPVLERWEPPAAAAAAIGGAAEQGTHTTRFWVVSPSGAVVRERPWGRVLDLKRRGMLLRSDVQRDGWARLEEDFVESGPLSQAGEEETDSPLLEGWVLIDGRDVGVARQLLPRNGEAEPPAAEARRAAAEEGARRAAKHAALVARGEDWSVSKLLAEQKLSDDVVDALRAAGVADLEGLIAAVSRGDHHEELKALGVTKLGQRAKLATLVQPYWKALTLKEQGNARYKDSRFEEAVALYSAAISAMPCAAVDLALNCYSNRAACHQQMREFEVRGKAHGYLHSCPVGHERNPPWHATRTRASASPDLLRDKTVWQLALADVMHVLEFDPDNAKALARKQVYEQALRL